MEQASKGEAEVGKRPEVEMVTMRSRKAERSPLTERRGCVWEAQLQGAWLARYGGTCVWRTCDVS